MDSLENIIKEKYSIIERLNLEINSFKEKINILEDVYNENQKIVKYFNKIIKEYDFILQNI